VLNIVDVRVDNEGLYVKGVVALSINKEFVVGDVVLLNGIKYVPFVLSLVKPTAPALPTLPLKLAQVKVDVAGFNFVMLNCYSKAIQHQYIPVCQRSYRQTEYIEFLQLLSGHL